jgi:hypothetical protein
MTYITLTETEVLQALVNYLTQQGKLPAGHNISAALTHTIETSWLGDPKVVQTVLVVSKMEKTP